MRGVGRSQSLGPLASIREAWLGIDRRCWRGDKRKMKLKARAPCGRPSDLEGSLVLHDDAMDQRQAEPSSAAALRRHVRRKQTLANFGRNPRAVVLDNKHARAVVGLQ